MAPSRPPALRSARAPRARSVRSAAVLCGGAAVGGGLGFVACGSGGRAGRGGGSGGARADATERSAAWSTASKLTAEQSPLLEGARRAGSGELGAPRLASLLLAPSPRSSAGRPHGLGSGRGLGKVARRTGVTFATEQSKLPPLLRLPRDEALWSLARPTIAIALLRSAYGIIDSVWVGRLGAAELEAMGASSFAFWVLLLLGEVASLGVHAVAAAREGAGILAMALLPLIPSYFGLLGVSVGSPAFAPGCAYLRGLVWGVVPLTASGVLASGFKGVAELRPVLAVNVVCAALNFALDPVLMWGGLGFPAMGVAGAAVATNFCSLVASVLSFRLLLKQGVPLRWAGPNLRTLALITRIGLPVSLGGILFTGIYIALGRLLGSLGGANLAALGLGHRVEAFAYTVCEGFGAAAATIVGQWLGAGHERQARESASHAARVAGWVLLPLAMLFVALAKPIISLITSDPATIAPAVSYLYIVSITFPLMGVEHVMDGALTGAGDTTPSLVWGLVLNLARLPAALWLCRRFGVEGVWTAITVSTALKAVVKWRAFRRSRLPLLSGSAVA